MHRPYTGALFEKLVATIHQHLPEAAIGVDTLIGFPGESEAAFENTYRLVETLPVTYMHVFPFSPRRGTPAYYFKERVPDTVVKERCRRMRDLGERKKRVFYQRLVGKRVRVLVEGSVGTRQERIKGMTDNYVPIQLRCPAPIPETNTFVEAVVQEVTSDLRVLGTQAD
jgi:threonylcarbamoyladenosine tRNA methylthiotransferase MtaB